jgi:hypothetical protein
MCNRGLFLGVGLLKDEQAGNIHSMGEGEGC